MPSAARTSKKKTEAAAAVVAAVPEAPVAAAAPKRKSTSTAAKKPVKVVAVVTPDGIEGSFTPEPRRPLIAHLQVRSNEVVFHDQALRYDPTPPLKDPEPYDEAESNMFREGQELVPPMTPRVGHEEKEQAVEVDVSSKKEGGGTMAPAVSAEPKSMPCFTKVDLMVQFRGGVEEKRLPDSTDVACFWCTHTFEGMPCVIPEREVAGVYSVYGNFCCPECAVAYLLAEGIDPHARWERLALLHRIYDAEGQGRIFPAPSRAALKLFGGPMTIETFRATVREKKVRVDLHMPPMVSILGSIDTKPIDFFDTNMRQAGVNGEMRMPQRSVEEGLRLKRTKPLKDKESTLDAVMNIRIGSAW